LGNFTFRTFEFEQMEIEYFIHQENWEKHFEEWKDWMWQWLAVLGISENKLRWRKHSQEELSHYSKRTEDIEYDFPFGGFKELYGLAYRTDYDLKQHAKFSGVDLQYRDPETGEKFFPHVVEPTFGVTRTALVLLLDAYHEDGDRVVLRLNPRLAPYKAAVFPLLANKPKLVKKAREVFENLKGEFHVAWDDRGNIGKRYYAQDEIGTPWCITIDFQTLEDDTVTVRDRDTTKQVRVRIEELKEDLGGRLEQG
jgi:glycyl-tRNA synthetase